MRTFYIEIPFKGIEDDFIKALEKHFDKKDIKYSKYVILETEIESEKVFKSVRVAFQEVINYSKLAMRRISNKTYSITFLAFDDIRKDSRTFFSNVERIRFKDVKALNGALAHLEIDPNLKNVNYVTDDENLFLLANGYKLLEESFSMYRSTPIPKIEDLEIKLQGDNIKYLLGENYILIELWDVKKYKKLLKDSGILK